MRILLVHQYFLRPGDGGGSRFNEFARMWSEAGHEVTVLAGQVHYGSGRRYPDCRGRWIVRERAGDVTVVRVYTPGTYHAGRFGRMWTFLAYTISATAAVLRRLRRSDVVIATSPPLVTAVQAIVASRLGTPTVFEVRDLWPESAVTMGMLAPDGWLTRLLYRLEALVYRSVDRIVVLTPAFRDDIVDRGLAHEEEIATIPNGADLEWFAPGPSDPELRRRLGWDDKFVALYAGAHGPANHLIQWVEAGERLKGREDIVLAAVGDGPEREILVAETRRRGLENVQFLGPVPKADMPALLRAADVGAAVLKRVDTFKTVYPNKIFDTMASGRPVLCVVDGIARRLVVDEAEAGVYAEPEHPDAIARAIVDLADDPGRRRRLGEAGRSYVVEHFSREALSRSYLEILEEIVG